MPNISIGLSLNKSGPLGIVGGVAGQIPVPQDLWIEGDSYAGYLQGGVTRGGFEQAVTNTGIGGSTMVDAVARVATNQATYADRILVFIDGIYGEYVDAATAATNIANISTNAGSTEWIYIPPVVSNIGGSDAPTLAKAQGVRVIASEAAATYPDNVFDIWPLVAALAQNAQDDADVAAGYLPRSAYADDYHLSDATWDALAPAVTAAIEARWQTVAPYVPVGTPDSILGASMLSHVDPTESGMLQTTGGAAATADGDRVQVLPDQNGGAAFTNSDTALRPTLRIGSGLTWLESNDDAFLSKSLSRSGAIYICAAVQTPVAGREFISTFHNQAPMDFGAYYEFQRNQFDPQGYRAFGSDGGEVAVVSDTDRAYVVEVIMTPTERTLVLHREGMSPIITSSNGTWAMNDTSLTTLFGIEGESGPEGIGRINLYSYVSANAIPEPAARDNLVHLAAAKAGLGLLPPVAFAPEYWRYYVTETGQAGVSVREFEAYAAGDTAQSNNLFAFALGGEFLSSSDYSGTFDANNAFDGGQALWSADTVAPAWVGRRIIGGANPATFAITSRSGGFSDQTGREARFQYSLDGVAWQDFLVLPTQPAWGEIERREFTV